jgi:hypothetical protein
MNMKNNILAFENCGGIRITPLAQGLSGSVRLENSRFWKLKMEKEPSIS